MVKACGVETRRGQGRSEDAKEESISIAADAMHSSMKIDADEIATTEVGR